MTSETASFSASLSGGVHHSPEADIESIRDLLRGYGVSRSILKELIQNAEDSGAKRMEVLYVAGDPGSPHPLFRTPGLLVANNGTFSQENRLAIRQINLGTKGTEERAIGRFGKGLKSVFAWCEAFFITARTDPKLGWPEPYHIMDFFNPWHGWLHGDWDEAFEQNGEKLLSLTRQHLSTLSMAHETWLAFWFPLRCASHTRDGEETDSFDGSLPGEDRRFLPNLFSELRTLAPSLVSMRSLRRICISNGGGSAGASLVWEFPNAQQRIPPPDQKPGVEFISGQTLLRDQSDTPLLYTGYAGRLEDHLVADLKSSENWPRVVQRTHNRSRANCPVKGEPHYASLLSWFSPAKSEARGSLEVRWCVFFPVGKQPAALSPVKLTTIQHAITLNLHGFFFLDSERLRIDGLDDAFQHNGATSTGVCVRWNHTLASQGALTIIPDTFAALAEQEQFSNAQRQELASAFQQIGVWTTFKNTICHRQSWRPRWRVGGETWELVPSSEGIFLIPRPANVAEVLRCIPKLSAFSQQVNLVTRDSHGDLPGLHDGKLCNWPEALALELLDGAQLSPTSDRAAAEWLNHFLDLLHGTKSLTAGIRERISQLPLLPVRAARTGTQTRISVREWEAASAAGQLFGPGPQTDAWLRLLDPSLPDWSCLIHDWRLPNWFEGSRPPLLDDLAAASAIVSQSRLGDFPSRAAVVHAFLSKSALPEPARVAVRYLMHTDASHASDPQPFLFVPSVQAAQLIWSRLIEALLRHEGGENSWRVLHQQWASVLSPQAQVDLSIATIDAQGAWEELMTAKADFSTLHLPVNDWSVAEVGILLHGLFQAGQADLQGTVGLLRKLRLHSLRGQSNERVPIAGADGRLGNLFVLHTPDFEAAIPADLRPLWERFQSATKIVERIQDGLASAVQEKLFHESTDDGQEYDATLDWNFVVRRCLETGDACVWWPLIMEALSHGDQAVRGLGAKLKQTEWLPLTAGASVAPDSVILVEGLEEELMELLDPAKDGLAGTRALLEPVTEHQGFSTLKKYFPNLEEALELLGLWLKDKPDWHLGLAEQSLPGEVDKFLQAVETLADVPGAGLLAKFWRLPSQTKNAAWDELLRQYIWPEVFRPFPYEQGGAARLERVVIKLGATSTRVAFDSYLRQAVADSVVEPMLAQLSLVNQRGQWCSPRKLIWPSANLDPAAQLCYDQAKILSPIRRDERQRQSAAGAPPTAPIAPRGNQLSQEPDFESQADILAEYIKPFRNGNVGEILPAALVSVLGVTPKMRALLRELLQAGLGQQPDDFITLLLGESRKRLIEAAATERFLIEIVRGNSTQAQAITGGVVTVSLTDEISSLLVGDPDALWCRHFYHYRQETACHLLRLRSIDHPDELTDPVGIFASTIETILLKVHCNGVASLCPSNLKEVLAEVADAGQADLRRSQFYLLDMAEARLKELVVRGLPQFDRVLQQFNDARQARVDAELLKSQAPSRAKEKREMAESLTAGAKLILVNLLQSPQDEGTQRMLVDAVRRKMTDFQYSLDSVALELFQNADDAVAEWEQMKPDLHPHERQFVLHLDAAQRRLELIHWGRPINRHAFAGFQQGLQRGYDQDLQKMLTLNFSDKGVGNGDQAAIVTGRFGLGFKTVFFVADQPEVISGRLAFEIRGGFYPVPLPLDRAKALRGWAEGLGSSGLVPTAIRLHWAADTKAEDVANAFAEFTRIAPLLAIFSRCIRTLNVADNNGSTTITSNEQGLTSSKQVTHIQVGQESFLCFRCGLRTDERPASVLFTLDAEGVSHLPENLPRLWITTPTTEHSDFRWALNAPFKPDAGRQRLALNNPLNRQVAEEVAQAWLQSLVELFDETQLQWEALARKLGLHSTASLPEWWRQIWSEMTRSLPVCRWEHLRDGGQVLGYTAWGQNTGAMLRFVQQRPAIPSQLPGAYSKFLKAADVRFSVKGLLADQANGCFCVIGEWSSVQKAFPPGQTVDAEVERFLKHVIPAHKVAGELNLRTVLDAEMGEQKHVNHIVGERLGQLFIECPALFGAVSPYAPEVQPLLSSLREANLLAADGNYYPASKLISEQPFEAVIEKDEPLRAAFAPPSAVLSSGYSKAALHFFVKARGQLAANASTLADWVTQAPQDKLPAIFKYLIQGELSQQLADQLKRPWLDAQRSTPAFLGLSESDRNELERKFSRGMLIVTPTPILTGIIDLPPAFQVMSAEVAFRRVSEWWAREQKVWTQQYESRTYPPGFPGLLPWPGEDEWDEPGMPNSQARWLLLFIHAALVPLGFNRIGRDQSFTRFLVNNGWVDVFSRVCSEPQALFHALDSYLGTYIQSTEYHFQMRQFITFYAVSKNLDTFLHSLQAAEQTDRPEAFNQVFNPNANPGLIGTGIIAPPIGGMLGMGTCQLLRELYRLKRLTNAHGYRFAFTPLRKVRRLSTQLFGTNEGYSGASASVSIFEELQALGTELKLDPTFNGCFDLPLQILAENKTLRTQVLKEEFEAEAMDSPELDAAPPDYTR